MRRPFHSLSAAPDICRIQPISLSKAYPESI